MKKLTVIVLLVVCVFALAACDRADTEVKEKVYEFYGTILEVEDQYILVEPAEDSLERRSSDKIRVPVDAETAQPALQVGDTVKIVYDGMIQELYPAILPNVSSVEKQNS